VCSLSDAMIEAFAVAMLAAKQAAAEPAPVKEASMLMPTAALAVFAFLSLRLGVKGALLAVVFHLVGLIVLVLDLTIWVVTFGPIKTAFKTLSARSVFAKPVAEVAINGKGQPPSKVWRSVEAIAAGELIATPFPGCTTAAAALERAYKVYASSRAQGSRVLLSWRSDEGFKFPAKVFGETVWRTYAELGAVAQAVGAGLRSLGSEPQPAGCTDVAKGLDHRGILIYDETSPDWMALAQGAFSQDIAVATCYATLGADAVVKAVKQGGVTVLCCNRNAIPTVLKSASELKTLKAIVYTSALCTPEDMAAPLPAAPPGVTLLSFDELVALGTSKPCEPTPPKPDSLAVLMYTSGSTGDPKGVMVTQANLLAMMATCSVQFGSIIKPDAGEVYLGYLPLAHILELSAEFFYLSMGNIVAYADPKSLLGGPERAYPHGAFDEFKPTLMAGVPKVWEGIKAGAQAKVAKSGKFASFLISFAIKMKAMADRQRRSAPLMSLLLKKFKNTTGGGLKGCLSGGGAISAEVQEWCRTALDCPLMQGYGLTETCAGATIQMHDDLSIGIAGTPVASCEIALHSEPEITDSDGKPYLATDTLHSTGAPCCGRGEVWLRGTNVTRGYYKLPEQTAAEFDADGFFHTGDIGMLTPGGALVIIDRKKNLVKLKGGEYVALEKMNTAYNNSPFVNVEAGGVCSYAHDSLDRSVCLAQCKASELRKAAVAASVDCTDEELPLHPKVQEAVLKSFKEEAKKAGLTCLETVVAVAPLLEEWSTANGCLTATQKIVSKSIYKFNAKELEAIKVKGIK